MRCDAIHGRRNAVNVSCLNGNFPAAEPGISDGTCRMRDWEDASLILDFHDPFVGSTETAAPAGLSKLGGAHWLLSLCTLLDVTLTRAVSRFVERSAEQRPHLAESLVSLPSKSHNHATGQAGQLQLIPQLNLLQSLVYPASRSRSAP